MAKTKPESGEALTPETPLSLDEFCCRLSLEEKRYTLISGFHYGEKVAGRLTDTASAYTDRYKKYLTTPLI